MSFLRDFIRFSRLHTIVGTTLSILSLYVLAVAATHQGVASWDSGSIGLLLLTLASCLAANIYIVGLNQVTDVEIDRINKPYLPLASGAFSMRQGKIIIIVALVIALALAVYGGRYLLWTVVLSVLLGTAYSLPPLRLKRFHFWAAFCIIAVRGLIVNLLLFLHFQYQLSGQESIPALIAWLTFAIFAFGLIIAWFKDMPDVEGDQAYAINTLSLRLGVRRVFQIGNGLLIALFAGLALLPFVSELPVQAFLFSSLHGLMLLVLLLAIRQVDLSKQAAIARYYQTIWLLFFAEYVTFALSGWLG